MRDVIEHFRHPRKNIRRWMKIAFVIFAPRGQTFRLYSEGIQKLIVSRYRTGALKRIDDADKPTQRLFVNRFVSKIFYNHSSVLEQALGGS